MKRLIPFLTVLALMATSHSKAQTYMDHLSSGTWKILAMGTDSNGDGNAEHVVMRPCHVGSTLIFAPNGAGKAYKGPNPCNPAGPSTTDFNWTKKGEDLLEFSSGAQKENWRIISATEHKLVLWMTTSHLLYTLQK